MRVALKRPSDSGIFEGVSRSAFKASGTFVPRSADFVGTVSDVTDLIDAAQTDMKLCIDQTGFMGIGVQPMGVLIQKGAANTTGVQPITSGSCV